MQAKISTLQIFDKINTQSFRHFFRNGVAALFFIGTLIISQQAHAQLRIGVIDIEFAPSGPGYGLSTNTLVQTSTSSDKSTRYNENQDPISASSSTHDTQEFKTVTPNYMNTKNGLSLSMYPNPANDRVNISKPEGIVLQRIEVLDIQGNVRFAGKFVGGFVQAPYIEPGMYNFKVYTNYGVVTKLMSVN